MEISPQKTDYPDTYKKNPGPIFFIMKTCRTFYNAGTPIIIDRETFLEGGPSEIDSFNTFMLRNHDYR